MSRRPIHRATMFCTRVMEKRVFLISIIGIVLFPLLSWAIVFTPHTVKKIPGKFYFTPAASSSEFALFGYMSKITPTPKEIEAEKKRITTIIDEGIKKEYGSWKNFEKVIRKAGKETSREMQKETPGLFKTLMPPSLVKEAVPLLLKGALLFAKAHPEAMREPVGNVGETGVIVVDSWGGVTKIPLGLNVPVTSIDISPDGWKAAVLTDMSFEDKAGQLHVLGEISLIDLRAKKRTRSWVFANLAGHVAFVPTVANLLAFTCYTDMRDFGKQELVFLDLKSGQLRGKYRFPIIGSGSASIHGRNVHYPGFKFAHDKPIVALYTKGIYELRNIITGEKLFKVKTNSHILAFSHSHPWLFTGLGELWDYQKKSRLAVVKRSFSPSFPLNDVQFTRDDSSVIYLEVTRSLYRLDTRSGRVVATTKRASKRAGLFFLTPDSRYVVSFVPMGGLISYRGRYLRRQRLCLRIFDTQNLRWQQDICVGNSTVVDAAVAGRSLIVSDFESLHVYANASFPTSGKPLPAMNTGSVLARIDKDPAKFAGKIIELDGWAWGWMARAPRELQGKRISSARHNYGSRNDGTFTDGVISVLYPVPVQFSGRYHLKARVVITPYGWRLKPVDG